MIFHHYLRSNINNLCLTLLLQMRAIFDNIGEYLGAEMLYAVRAVFEMGPNKHAQFVQQMESALTEHLQPLADLDYRTRDAQGKC